MTSSLVQSSTAHRQLTPLSLSVMKEVAVVDPITPVWARGNTRFNPLDKSDEDLLDFYAEELFIEEQAADEDEAESSVDQQAIVDADKAWSGCLDRIILAGLVCSVQSSFTTHDAVRVLATPVRDEKPACRPSPVGTDVLFDRAAPEDIAEEISLYAIFDPEEFPALFMRLVTQVEYIPTPELLDTKDLMLHPTRITDSSLFDPVSQMLDFYPSGDEVQETASVYTPRQGRSLIRAPPPCSGADDKEYGVENHGESRMRRDANSLDVGNDPRGWEAEFDHVLNRLTRRAFLPGVEHLTNIESRSVFITYDNDIEMPKSVTSPVPNSCRAGRCTCLIYRSSIDTSCSSSFESPPTSKSVLDTLDEIIDDEISFENDIVISTQLEELSPSGIFQSTASAQYTSHATADHLMTDIFLHVSDLIRVYSNGIENVSDMFGEDVGSPSSAQFNELTYIDADTQQHVGYTALNQLLTGLDDFETLPRIHHAQDDYDSYHYDLIEGIVEIDGVPPSNVVMGSEGVSSQFHSFDVDPRDNQCQPIHHTQGLSRSRSVDSLCSSWRFPKIHNRGRRPRLAVITQLDDILEVSSSEDNAPCGSSSSEASSGFEDQRAFVQLLATRRTDFLDGEESDDELDDSQSVNSPYSSNSDSSCPSLVPTVQRLLIRRAGFLDEDSSENYDAAVQWSQSSNASEANPLSVSPAPMVKLTSRRTDFLIDEDSDNDVVAPQSASSTDCSEAESYYAMPSPLTAALVENVYEFSNDAYRLLEPDMKLNASCDTLSSADDLPNPDIFPALECKFIDIVARMCECIIDGRTDELTELRSDLRWALITIAKYFPTHCLPERLTMFIELFLLRVEASGAN